VQEGIHNLHGKSRSYHASAHSQYIGIVVQAGRFRTEAVRTQRRADSRHLIGCNGNADSGSADQDSLVAGTLKDRVSNLSRVNRIVHSLRAAASEIFILQSLAVQICLYLLHQFISAMVTSKCYHRFSSSSFSFTTMPEIIFSSIS